MVKVRLAAFRKHELSQILGRLNRVVFHNDHYPVSCKFQIALWDGHVTCPSQLKPFFKKQVWPLKASSYSNPAAEEGQQRNVRVKTMQEITELVSLRSFGVWNKINRGQLPSVWLELPHNDLNWVLINCSTRSFLNEDFLAIVEAHVFHLVIIVNELANIVARVPQPKRWITFVWAHLVQVSSSHLNWDDQIANKLFGEEFWVIAIVL
jgi:hypothetical protein